MSARQRKKSKTNSENPDPEAAADEIEQEGQAIPEPLPPLEHPGPAWREEEPGMYDKDSLSELESYESESTRSARYTPTTVSGERAYTQIKMYNWGDETELEIVTFEHEPGFTFEPKIILCDNAIVDFSQYEHDNGTTQWIVRVFNRIDLRMIGRYDSSCTEYLYVPEAKPRWGVLEKMLFLERTEYDGLPDMWKLGRFIKKKKREGDRIEHEELEEDEDTVQYEMQWYTVLERFPCNKPIYEPMVRGSE